jgi:hypothetical protein
VPADPSPGIPSAFIAIFVIVLILGIASTIWRYTVLRRGGLNPFVAKEQLEARLAQSLSQQPTAAPAKTIEERLAELIDLHERGVISDEELAAGRAKVIAGD